MLRTVMRLAVLVLVLVLFAPSLGAAMEPRINVSGPEFLQGIGPREPRTDNRAAAVIVAVGVAAVILRGLRVDRQHQSAAK